MTELYFIDENKNLELIKIIDHDVDSRIIQIVEFIQTKYKAEPIFTDKNEYEIKNGIEFDDGFYITSMILLRKNTISIEGYFWNSQSVIMENLGYFLVKNSIEKSSDYYLKNFSSENIIQKFFVELNGKIELCKRIKNNEINEKVNVFGQIFDLIISNAWIFEINKFNKLRKTIYEKLKKFSQRNEMMDFNKYLNNPIFIDLVVADKLKRLD